MTALDSQKSYARGIVRATSTQLRRLWDRYERRDKEDRDFTKLITTLQGDTELATLVRGTESQRLFATPHNTQVGYDTEQGGFFVQTGDGLGWVGERKPLSAEIMDDEFYFLQPFTAGDLRDQTLNFIYERALEANP